MYRIVLLVIFLSGCQSYPNEKTNVAVFEVEGVWDWSSSESQCNKTWQVITKSANTNSLLFRNATPIERSSGELSTEYQYEILGMLKNGYHLAPQAEDRLNEKGLPVTWYLIFSDTNNFKWRRSDWARGSFTAPVQRCRKPNIADPFVTVNAYSSNPVYGTVSLDHPGFKKDMSECEAVSYGQGVFIEGQGVVKNRKELTDIRQSYSKPVLEMIKAKYKHYNFPNRYEIATMSGDKDAFFKEYMSHLKNVYSVFDTLTHPEHIAAILAMSDVFQQCFRVEKQWKALRTEWTDTRTGEVFNVSNITPDL